MSANEISKEIAALEMKVTSAKNKVLAKSLNSKISQLKEELKSVAQPTEAKMKLAKAKAKIRSMSKENFDAFVQKLSNKNGFAFLKQLTSDQIKRDIQRVAKPVGWRYRGRENMKKPLVRDIRSGNNVYFENRSNRADVSRAVRLKEGGSVGSYVKENKAFQDFKIELEKKYGKGYKNSDLSEKDFDKLFNLKERRSKSYVNKLPIENARNNMAKGGGVDGDELMGGQPNSSKPSGYTLVQAKGREIIVTDDGGKTQERWVKSNGYSGYTLHYKGNQYEFTDSLAKGGFIGKQANLDRNKNGKIDSEDLRMIRENKMAKGGGVGKFSFEYPYLLQQKLRDKWESVYSFAMKSEIDKNIAEYKEQWNNREVRVIKNPKYGKMAHGGTMHDGLKKKDETLMANGGKVYFKDDREAERVARPQGDISRDLLDRVKYFADNEESFVGNFGWRTPKPYEKLADGYLYKLDEYDLNLIKDIKLKSGEKVFRYFNRATAIGGSAPLIKINLDKGLLYWTIDNEYDEIKFDTKGYPALWIGVISSKISDGGKMAHGGQMESGSEDEFVIQDKEVYKSGSKWFATASKVYPNDRSKDAMYINGEGYTKKEALADLENNLSYYAKGGKVKFDKTLISSLPKNRRADKNYTHFAVGKSDNKILNGWDYSDYDNEDLNAFKKSYFYDDMTDMEYNKSEYTIKKAKTLISEGTNPFDYDNWRKLDFSNDKPYVQDKMANGGFTTTSLKEGDFVWNAVGKKLIVREVNNDEYLLEGFGSIAPFPFSKPKVDGYIKSGEWTLKPQMAKGGELHRGQMN